MRETLALAQSGLDGARWVAPEDLHITLRFLGDVSDEVAWAFSEAVAAIRCPRFSLALKGVGVFGGRRPKAVWARVVADEVLWDLQRAHEKAARAAGLPPEKRAFVPHVTLGRLKNSRPESVARYLARQEFLETPPMEVQEVTLFSARPGRGGGPYVPEEVFPLGESSHRSFG